MSYQLGDRSLFHALHRWLVLTEDTHHIEAQKEQHPSMMWLTTHDDRGQIH